MGGGKVEGCLLQMFIVLFLISRIATETLTCSSSISIPLLELSAGVKGRKALC